MIMDALPGRASARWAQQAINRGLSTRYRAAAADIDRLINAAYRIIAREGTVDIKVRELLAEAEFSTQNFYRYFPSKDEFFLVLLEDGQQRLLSYLRHRVAAQRLPRDRVQAIIESLLAQAEDGDASVRTRPFIVHKARLTEDRSRLDRDLSAEMYDFARNEITAARAACGVPGAANTADADFTLYLAEAVMERHILEGTKPTAAEKSALVGYCLRALQI
jgi:AcrR family transcriptional regulator